MVHLDILSTKSCQVVVLLVQDTCNLHFRLDLLLVKPHKGYSVHEGIMSNLPGGVNVKILPCFITV